MTLCGIYGEPSPSRLPSCFSPAEVLPFGTHVLTIWKWGGRVYTRLFLFREKLVIPQKTRAQG